MSTPPSPRRALWARLATAVGVAGLVMLAGASPWSLFSRPEADPVRVVPLVLPPYAERPFAFAWGPDGRTLAVGGDSMVALWDLEAGAPTQRLAVPARVEKIGWSPDRATLFAGAGLDDWSALWSVREGRGPYPLVHLHGLPRSSGIDPTGAWIATTPADGDVHVLDARTGALRGVLVGSGNGSLGWSPDGKLVAVGGRDGVLRVFEIATGKMLASAVVAAKDDEGYVSPTWSPEGDILLVAGTEQTTVLTAPGLARIASFEIGSIHDVAWRGGGRIASLVRVVRSMGLWEIGVFELRTGRLVRSIVVEVYDGGLALSPDGARLVVPIYDDDAKLYDAATGDVLAKLPGASWPVRWSPDGARFATGGRGDGAFAVWTRDGAPVTRVPRGGALRDVTWSRGGAALLLRDAADGSLRLVDPRGPSARVVPGGRLRVSGHAESPDHRWVAVGRVRPDDTCSARAVEIWSTDPWTKERELVPSEPGCVSEAPGEKSEVLVTWSPDGRLLAGTFGGAKGEVSVWETATWTRRGGVLLNEAPSTLAFSSGGASLGATAGDREVLIDTQTLALTWARSGLSGPALFSPRGDRLVWGRRAQSAPPAMTLLATPFTGEPLPLETAAYVSSLAWSADGAWIAAGEQQPSEGTLWGGYQRPGEATLWNVANAATRERRELPLQPGGASVGVAFRPGDAMLAASGDHVVLYRPSDGSSLAIHDIPLGDRLARLVCTADGHYDGDEEALRFLHLRVGDGAAATIVSSGPVFDGLRRPGLLQAFLDGR
jgi:WD40 repeat protein